MSIRQMLPVGTVLRKCIICGYPITAKSDALTAHELECLNVPSMTVEEVEKQAQLLWEQHEKYIERYLRILPTTWSNAPDGGKELMRQYARSGITDWLKAKDYGKAI